jgi:YD repeat-containing protein
MDAREARCNRAHSRGQALFRGRTPPAMGQQLFNHRAGTYSYNISAVTYNDEACVPGGTNNSWTRTSDGLGRLTQVTRSGIASTTTYGYDALDDLTSVTPSAGSGRTFMYTSLRQLTTAANPESGTVSYTRRGIERGAAAIRRQRPVCRGRMRAADPRALYTDPACRLARRCRPAIVRRFASPAG